MQVVYPCCCGLDVHKKSITACVLLWIEARGEKRKEKRVFGTFTRDLLKLSEPVWNILERQFEVLLVNAQHIKAVPGRKTDQKDNEWIADLLQHGLLRASFVPPSEIQDLRDLTDLAAAFDRRLVRSRYEIGVGNLERALLVGVERKPLRDSRAE